MQVAIGAMVVLNTTAATMGADRAPFGVGTFLAFLVGLFFVLRGARAISRYRTTKRR